MTKEGSTIIVNFMSPGAVVLLLGLGHVCQIVKIHHFFKNLLLYSQAKIRQTKYMIMMIKEGSTRILKFHDLWGRSSCAGACHITHVLFYLFYDGLLICTYEPFSDKMSV